MLPRSISNCAEAFTERWRSKLGQTLTKQIQLPARNLLYAVPHLTAESTHLGFLFIHWSEIDTDTVTIPIGEHRV